MSENKVFDQVVCKRFVIVDSNNNPVASLSGENGYFIVDLMDTRKLSINRDVITVYDGQGNERRIPFR